MINEKRQEFICLARTLLDVPWVHQGRNPATGLDCGGFVMWPAWQLGYLDKGWDKRRYGRNPDGHTMVEGLAANCDEIDPAKRQPGDILLFRNIEIHWPGHMAIYTERNGVPYMLHAWAADPAERVVETVLDSYWESRLVAVYAYKGIDE